MTYSLSVSAFKQTGMKWIISLLGFVCFSGICIAQGDSIPAGSRSAHRPLAVSDSSAKHDSLHKPHFPLFIRFAAGIGRMNSSYSTELITPGNPGINITHQYTGAGYEIPFEVAAGVQCGRFRISLGLTIVQYHVPQLSRQGDTLFNTQTTGSPVKHQSKQFGTNYFIPLSIDYRVYQKKQFELSARLGFGIYYHGMNAYDGGYAPSEKPDISGSSFSFGIVPAYVFKNISFFLNPCFRLDAVSYHRSTYDDLSDLSLSCSAGCCISF
jgi:hypothetical protein